MNYIIEGKPVAQKRPRLAKGRVFNPCSNQMAEVAEKLLTQRPKNYKYPTRPRICFVFIFSSPKSLTKDLRRKHDTGRLKHTHTQDADNLIKFYLDAMQGVLIEDDACVSIGYAIKIYGKETKTVITIEDMPEFLHKFEVSSDMWDYLYGSECDDLIN
jgi:Holliday junction resolvase RusA-like endonuclease